MPRLEQAVANGDAALLSDEVCAGGRFQEVAFVQGGELIIAQWHQDEAGDWRSRKAIFLKRGSVPKLADLLRRHGYHLMPVDPNVSSA